MLLFLDTEFTGLDQSKPDLISIGVVEESRLTDPTMGKIAALSLDTLVSAAAVCGLRLELDVRASEA